MFTCAACSLHVCSVLPTGTFHSIAARILRQHIDQLPGCGRDQAFTIIDQSDCKSLLRSFLKEKQLEQRLAEVRYQRSAVEPARLYVTIAGCRIFGCGSWRLTGKAPLIVTGLY